MAGVENFAFTILLPTCRPINITATSNTSVLQILEDVCKKAGLKALKWDLKYSKRILDLSLSVRFSGLPHKATLEMVKSTKPRMESAVKLIVLLESGKRLMEQFRPSQTLWEILVHWNEKGEKISLTGSEKGEEESQPTCVYMRQEIIGQTNLQSMTLRSLGLTHGSAIIRLLYKSANQLKHQANATVPLRRRSTKRSGSEDRDLNSKNTVAATCSTDENVVPKKDLAKEVNSDLSHDCKTKKAKLDNITSLPVKSPCTTILPVSSIEKPEKINNYHALPNSVTAMQTDKHTALQVPVIVSVRRYSKAGAFYNIGEKGAILYHSDDIVYRNENISDDFYDVVPADVESMYKDLKSKRRELEDSPLLTADHRALKKEQAVLKCIRDHPTTTLRIRFSNRYVLQGTFEAVETIGAVCEFVRKFLVDPYLQFYLFTAPPKKVLSNELQLVKEGLIGLAVVYFGSHIADEGILKPELYEKLSDPSIVCKNLPLAPKKEARSGGSENRTNERPRAERRIPAATFQNKSLVLPKWFK